MPCCELIVELSKLLFRRLKTLETTKMLQVDLHKGSSDEVPLERKAQVENVSLDTKWNRRTLRWSESQIREIGARTYTWHIR